MNISISSNKIKFVIKKNSQETEVQDQKDSQTSKEELIPIFLYSKKMEQERKLLNTFNEASIILIPKPDKDSTQKENYRPIFLKNVDVRPSRKY